MINYFSTAFFVLSVLFLIPTTVDAASGTLSVTTESIDIGSIPRGAQRIPMLRITLEASCEETVAINNMTFTHEGLGLVSDIARVYLAEGRGRISRATRFSTGDQTATIRLRSFVVPACETRTLTLLVDYASSAVTGSEHRAVIAMPSDITTDSTVNLEHTNSDGSDTPVRIVPETVGTITVEYLSLRSFPFRYGPNRVLQRFLLEADNESDHAITQITFTNDGKARDDDLQNLRLTTNGGDVLTTTKPTLVDDKVTFTLSTPLQLRSNGKVQLRVVGDIRASRRKTINLVIEEPSDIVAMPVGRSVRQRN